jgi:ribonuclease R
MTRSMPKNDPATRQSRRRDRHRRDRRCLLVRAAGTALDREALKRGNSAYFPDRVVPMLPERISNDLCSLREGEDRPALAVRMSFSSEGRKISHRFHRVMIKSAAKLSYQQAQAAIDGAGRQDRPAAGTGAEAALERLPVLKRRT